MMRLRERIGSLLSRSSDGTVTVFTSLVLVPVVTAVFIAGQAGITAYKSVAARSRLQYAVMSAAASYDRDLLENYGLYGVTAGSAGAGVALAGRLDSESILRHAVTAEGWRVAGSGILDRMVSKIQDIAGKFASPDSIDSLREATGQAVSMSWREIMSVVGANLPEFDIENIIPAVKNLITTFKDNNITLDDSWLWKDDGLLELDVTGILDQSIVKKLISASVISITID